MESGTSSAPSLPQPRVVSTTIPDEDTGKDVHSAAATKQARTDSQVNENLNNFLSILRLLCYSELVTPTCIVRSVKISAF